MRFATQDSDQLLGAAQYHFFPLPIHSMQCIHCLLQLCYKIFNRHLEITYMLTLYFWVACFLMVSMLVCGYLCLIIKETTRDYERRSIFNKVTLQVTVL